MSLLRIIGTETGSLLINLTKVSMIEQHGSHIIYSFSKITPVSLLFTGGGYQQTKALYSTVEDAKSDFDIIVKDLNNFYH